jgi:cyclin G-associated kinase
VDPTTCDFLFSFIDEKEPEMGPENTSPKESRSVLIPERDGSEMSDEEELPFPSEDRQPGAGEDTPGLTARSRQQDLIFEAVTPATPQETAPSEEGIDLLGLHSEVDLELTAPSEACRPPSSNADLLSRLLGPPDSAPVGSPGDLLGNEAPLLLASPVTPLSARSTSQGGTPATGTHFCSAES